jgi:methyl-accepting chemotaxis protein
MDMPDHDATVQFLLRQSAKHEEAIGELSNLMALHALRAAEQYEKTEEQFRRTEEQFRRTAAKIEKLADRIDSLVSAIGVIVTRLPSPSA